MIHVLSNTAFEQTVFGCIGKETAIVVAKTCNSSPTVYTDTCQLLFLRSEKQHCGRRSFCYHVLYSSHVTHVIAVLYSSGTRSIGGSSNICSYLPNSFTFHSKAEKFFSTNPVFPRTQLCEPTNSHVESWRCPYRILHTIRSLFIPTVDEGAINITQCGEVTSLARLTILGEALPEEYSEESFNTRSFSLKSFAF